MLRSVQLRTVRLSKGDTEGGGEDAGRAGLAVQAQSVPRVQVQVEGAPAHVISTGAVVEGGLDARSLPVLS